MNDQAKFYVFAGVFGVGIIGLLTGIYFWDFAPKAAHPGGDRFVGTARPQAARTAQDLRRPQDIRRPQVPRRPQATRNPRAEPATALGIFPTRAPVFPGMPGKSAPEMTAGAKTSSAPTSRASASSITPANPESAALQKMEQSWHVLRQEVRVLRAEQIRMDQQLQQLQRVTPARSSFRPAPAADTAPVKNAKKLAGWTVESIGPGQAWLEGPSGNTHVVQAGATLDGFRVLGIRPDQVLTSRGRITY